MDNILKIPYGMRDFLPEEAKKKREIENKLAELFSKWGYSEVVTPTIEYLDTLTMGGRLDESRIYKFPDKKGKMLSLRHEMTTPIARLVGSRFKESPLPLKLSYITNVYRRQETQLGRQCEFYQAGIELIGSGDAAADSEVIQIAIESLKISGLKNFRLMLGNVEFIRGILEQYKISEKNQNQMGKAIEQRNLVEYENIIESLDVTAEGKSVLKEIPYLKGKDDVLKKAHIFSLNSKSRRAIDHLFEIYEILKSNKVSDFVAFDLGLIRDASYYTGMIFEAYTEGLGFSICGGGRYDNLLSEFGRPLTGAGFALGIERIMLANNVS